MGTAIPCLSRPSGALPMKISKIEGLLLAGLLAAATGLMVQRATIERLRGAAGQTEQAGGAVEARREGGGSAAGRAAVAPAADMWTKLKSEDGAILVKNLRAAGFPPTVVRAMVAAAVHESFLPKYRAALPASANEWDYWRAGTTYYDTKMYSTVRALAREEGDTLNRLLGPDATAGDNPLEVLNVRKYGPISAEKAEQLKRIGEDYTEMIYDARNAMLGLKLPGDAEKIAYLEAEQRADIAKLLTPEELEAYNLRSSLAAAQLRSRLAGFDPTPEEFRAIFAKQQEFDAKYGQQAGATEGGNSPERMRAQSQFQNSIRAALGDERYRAYQQTTDPLFLAANRVAQRLQLPAQAATDVWAVQQEYVKNYTALVANKEITAAQRYAEVTKAYEQANTKITGVLGTTGTEVYRGAVNGWLTPPKPPAGTKK